MPVRLRPIALAGALVCCGILLHLGIQSGWFLPRPNTIRELAGLPIGTHARLRAVITYSDSAGKRFWVQDDTGAIAIDQDARSFGVRVGQLVDIRGRKTRPFDSFRGVTSIGLADLKVAPIKTIREMPAPVMTSLRTLPDKEKIGVRVQVTGVVRQVTRDGLGRMQLAFADNGREVPVTLSEAEGNPSRWIDARVRVTGVGESWYNDSGAVLGQHVWVQRGDDIQIEEPASQTPLLSSIRGLYSDADARKGHRVRIRGRLAGQLAPTAVLLEDSWGAIRCVSETPFAVDIGEMVEVTGFPDMDGLRVDLSHSLMTEVDAGGAAESDNNRNLPTLTTIAAIRGLDPDLAATALPVSITGVVTYNDPIWRHLFVQDSSGGIFVKYSGSLISLSQGQRIAVRGVTNPGDFAPVIAAAKFLDLGKGTLPRPVSVQPGDAVSGILDSQFVEVEGVIHPMRLGEETSHLTFELFSAFGPIHVYAGPKFASAPFLHELEDTKVRVRGVFAAVFNSRRQLVGSNLSVASSQDIRILEPAVPAPFNRPAIPAAKLLRYSPHADLSHRVKVQGSVTLVGRGFFYLQDDSGGLEIQGDANEVHIGDSVEATGYVTASGRYSPILVDARIRVVGKGASIAPKDVTAEALLSGQSDSELISVNAHLLSAVDTLYGKSLVLQSNGVTFNARLETPDSVRPMPDLQPGTLLRLTGVCSAQVDTRKLYLLVLQNPVGFSLSLRSDQDVRVLERPSWWTARNTMAVLAVVMATTIAVLIWVSYLRRRVRRQTEALQAAREKAEAVSQLAAAMQEVTKGKEYGTRVVVRGGEDITQLCRGFNRMLTELEVRASAARAAEEQLEHQALTDELTGLPNRRLLSDRLIQALAVARREHYSVGLLYLDLDGFKLVNDSLGHSVGDSLLAEVAGRLRSRLRESDTLARLGGDEFTLVLTALRDTQDAEQLAHDLLEVIGRPYLINGHEITISASIGISFFPENAANADQLLQQADSAMYSAKRNGKNHVLRFTSELGSSVRERLNLENLLRAAIAHGEIAVHYQPEFDVRTNRLVRFEALARWNHSTLGAIPPAKFIPIAEESGLIIPLGAYILERACSEAVKWKSLSSDLIQVAVNVSSLQFTRDTFVEEVAEVLRHTGLDPRLLQIELTESVMLSGAERAAQTMRRLRAIGISLVIDDFGTGYSCLSYLPKLPFDALKVDRSFVNELEIRPETKAMVNSLVTLAHNLDMQVIVEGVETPQQLELIKALGANEVQGFLLGKPSADPEAQIRASRNQDAGEAARLAAKAGRTPS